MAKRFISLAEIKAHQFVGNHASDMAAFHGIDAFVADKKNSVADRAGALRVMYENGMGLDPEDITDEALIAQHLAESGEEDDGDDDTEEVNSDDAGAAEAKGADDASDAEKAEAAEPEGDE